MPVNILERHPYLNYRDEIQSRKRNYKGLIIGSFPIYACSNILDENLNVAQENNFENQIRMRFFYGSNRSEFWDYLFEAFGDQNEINKENAINLLERNDLIITDVLYQTNRTLESSSDIDLMINGDNNFVNQNLSLNYSLLDIINENQEIDNLYFTATGLNGRCPFGWFRQFFDAELRFTQINNDGFNQWGLNCIINNRHFNVFMLPTPKPRGIHFTDNQRHFAFVNYLQNIDIELYNLIENLPMANWNRAVRNLLTNYRKQFLIETYRQAFIEKNLFFNGDF